MATTYDKASLVMIPSGVKESKLYSIKPTDGSGDFTFSRGADTATRVNASGLIEKETSNLVLQSNQFDTTWSLVNASTLTSGQSGYDGSNDAWLLTKVAAQGRVIQSVTASNSVNTFSIYAKANASTWLRLLMFNGGDVFYDLQNGVIGTSSGIDSTITAVGATGWYRCTISVNNTIGQVRVYPADSDGNTGGTSGSIYIQDAQLNQGLVAQDYLETTTTAVYGGVTDNLPRLDYSGGASCPSLLLEPQRTNVIDYSEYYNVNWGLTRLSVTNNNAVSPEGVQNASLLIPDTSSSSTHRMRRAVSVTAGQNHTFSCFLKKENYAYAQLRSGTGWQINVDLNDGSFTTSGTSLVAGDVEDYGNGWYRAYVVGLEAGSSQGYDLSVFNSDSFGSFAGDGTSGVLAYGAQVELGSYPTSYIPTYGSSETRVADLGYLTGASDLIGQTEGTIYAEFEIPQDFYTTDDYRFSIGDGGINNWIFVSIYNTNNIRVFVRTASTTSIDEAELGVISHGTTYKLALAYKSGSTSCYLNGTEIISSSATISAPSTSLSNLNLTGDSSIQTSSPQTIGVNLKQRLQFKTRLTNAELAALTA